ncbi:MAG: GDP-L-fucose synthase [Rhodoferax sp.]|nr:GDP-L-fucose synthase [Rhodoferax sp.]
MHQRIFVAGHRGMVGSAIVRQLQSIDFVIPGTHEVIPGLTRDSWIADQSLPRAGSGVCNDKTERCNDKPVILTRTHAELDLTDQSAVRAFFEAEKPDQVYLAAAKVGGIHANNTYPADFIYQNLMVQANVIDAAFHSGVKKLLFLGSSCIYPRLAPQPMREDALLTGPLEPTNEPYAIAKIAGIKLCESYNRQYGASHGVDYRCVMPTNLYGPGDNYHPKNSHVIPALIRRFHEAKAANAASVAIWGSGTPKREFLYVDDMAAASVFVMNLPKAVYDQHTSPMLSHINVGCGSDITIAQVAQAISNTVGYRGQITFDPTQPDGSPRKLMDSSRLNALGWQARVKLPQGLVLAYQDFIQQNSL